MSKLVQYLKEVIERGGSDLHMSVNSPPMMRLFGELVPLENYPLSSDDTVEILGSLLNDEQMMDLEKYKNIDFALELPYAGYVQRYRCNFFFQKSGLDGVFRVIPREIPSLRELNLPSQLEDLALFLDGLILVTGPTGCGKSTTIAALVDIINTTQARHIITLEDPIEFVHRNKLSIIHQRQVNMHVLSFERAVRAAMREDTDVIIMGETRDLNSVENMLTAASMGHLVFSTMHTASAPKAVERIVEFYPPSRRTSVRMMLADCLRAIIAQQLIPRSDEMGRVPAVEIMVNNLSIANLIRESKVHQIPTVIQTGKQFGMVSMDDFLMKLFNEGKITAIEAFENSIDKKKLESVLRQHRR
ncbi:MAG: PilT/PilU family type 4a pilus ATPase [Firmicutes bacterium]|nr:PilT/PilU family type 4a pilus ATPase [Bacillota bacterium]